MRSTLIWSNGEPGPTLHCKPEVISGSKPTLRMWRLHHPPTGCRRLLIWLAGLALLLGCSAPDTGPEQLTDYVQRLATATNEPIPPYPRLVAPPRIADAAIRPVVITHLSIDVLDFLSLSPCELQVNIGRRNSLLGRSASPSQQLLLDLEFLALAPACISALTDTGDTALVASLQSLTAQKQGQLQARIFNALLAASEWRDFWRLPPSLGDYPATVSGDVVDSLHWLNRHIQHWLAGNYAAGGQELEYHLGILRSGDGGYLLLAAALQARELERASLLLQQRPRSLCPGGGITESARIAERVILKYFLGVVQPWLAKLNLREQPLMAVVDDIETQLKAKLTAEYSAWQTTRNALLGEIRRAPLEHVAAIKKAFSACHGMTLGSSGVDS